MGAAGKGVGRKGAGKNQMRFQLNRGAGKGAGKGAGEDAGRGAGKGAGNGAVLLPRAGAGSVRTMVLRFERGAVNGAGATEDPAPAVRPAQLFFGDGGWPTNEYVLHITDPADWTRSSLSVRVEALRFFTIGNLCCAACLQLASGRPRRIYWRCVVLLDGLLRPNASFHTTSREAGRNIVRPWRQHHLLSDVPGRVIWVEIVRHQHQLGLDVASMPAGWMHSLSNSLALFDGRDDTSEDSDGPYDQWWDGWPDWHGPWDEHQHGRQ